MPVVPDFRFDLTNFARTFQTFPVRPFFGGIQQLRPARDKSMADWSGFWVCFSIFNGNFSIYRFDFWTIPNLSKLPILIIKVLKGRKKILLYTQEVFAWKPFSWNNSWQRMWVKSWNETGEFHHHVDQSSNYMARWCHNVRHDFRKTISKLSNCKQLIIPICIYIFQTCLSFFSEVKTSDTQFNLGYQGWKGMLDDGGTRLNIGPHNEPPQMKRVSYQKDVQQCTAAITNKMLSIPGIHFHGENPNHLCHFSSQLVQGNVAIALQLQDLLTCFVLVATIVIFTESFCLKHAGG